LTSVISEPPELPDSSVQVLVVERHTPSRLGYGLLMQRQRWVGRCLLSADIDEAVEVARRLKPDLAIVDISDSGPRAAPGIARMRGAHSGISIVLSTRNGIASPQSLGARILTSSMTSDQIVEMVLATLLGDQQPAADSATDSRSRLSAREREVLLLLSTGATNREIADQLSVSIETVKKHAGTLYRKLGVRNRTEAARRAPELSAA